MTRSTRRETKDTAIALSQVGFRWPGTAGFALDVPELSVPRGESLLLLGASGSGKSTLLNLICGISEPSEGSVMVLGTDLVALTATERDRFRADHMGIIFQMFNLLPYASALDNVLLPLSFAAERRKRAEANDSAREEALRLLDALQVDQPHANAAQTATLSIGQQQRVAAARALIGQPEIIIADEPTSALDDASQDAFLETLFAQLEGSGSTLIMVSHDTRLKNRFDRAVRIEDVARTSRERAA